MNIREKYTSVRNATETICKPLKAEDYVVQPALFASPAKWHLAHTTWFFEAFVLKEHLANYKVFHQDFSYLFNSYYNNIGTRVLRADRGNITRPDVNEIYAYRKYVNKHINTLLLENSSPKIEELIVLGCNHEQQHQELLRTDIKYMLGHNPTFPIYDTHQNLVHTQNTSSGFVAIKEGVYEIGYQGNGFCYDNELGKHKVYINDFEISNSLVTNGEYIEFINDEGYKNFNYWLDEGWSWLQKEHIEAPLYWHKINNVWHYYTLAGLQEVNKNAVLSHISFYEANAFATWKKMRLPTEFEWEIASHQLDWGTRWEWTNSAYLPYPKFKKAEGAVGEYNGKFMINQMVLRGASVATAPNHSSYTYRNFFHPNERWQFTGIRLIK